MKKTLAILLTLAIVLSIVAGATAFADGDVVEINIWHMEEVDSRVQQFNMVADKFNALHDDILG